MNIEHTYLESIQIKNYRLCKDTKFSPNGSLAALIGPNGSGKTTILKSLLLLRSLAYGSVSHRSWRRDPVETDPVEISASMVVNGHEITHKSKILIDNDNSNNDEIIYSVQKWVMPDITKSRKQFEFPISYVGAQSNQRIEWSLRHQEYFPVHVQREIKKYPLDKKNKEVDDALEKVCQFYRGITYYSASKFTNPGSCPVHIEIDDDFSRRLGGSRSGHEQWLSDVYRCFKERGGEFKSFLDVVGKNGVGLIDDFSFEEVIASKVDLSVRIGGKIKKKEKTNKIVIPQIHINKSILSPSQLSEGTFKTLGMVFYLMTGKNSLILIEEPEVCIHHGLLSSIIELIKHCSSDRQIFISTHSDYFLDCLDPSNVHVVRKDPVTGVGVSRLKKYLSPGDNKALKNFLDSEGNLGEFWRTRGFDD